MATTHSDTSVNSLVINKLTKAQYDALETKSETELYLVPDEIDNAPTSGSDNPVKSGGVYNALQGKVDTSSLATVATSGSYNDLTDKPTIPSAAANGEFSIKTKSGSAAAVTAAKFTANQSTNNGLTLIKGDNITLTTDAVSNTITIAATDTTYGDATTSAAGLMSSSDKTKLDGIATGATANVGTITKVGNTSSGDVTVTSSNNSASFGNAVTVGTVGGVDLKFTMPANPNTHYTAIPVAGGSSATSNATSNTADPYINIVENSTKSGGIQIKGAGATSVTAANGVITISSTDTNTQAVTSVVGQTGAVTATQIANALTTDGHKLTDTWRPLGSGATDAAAGNHTHDISLASDTGTSGITLAHGGKYKLTAGGKSTIFTLPSDNNTTYEFTNGTNGFTVTPSGGSAQTITVTPSITNNVTANGNFAANAIIVGNGASQVAKNSGKTISTTAPSSESGDTTVPTSKAVWTAIGNGIATNDAMVYKGTIAGGSTGSYGALTGAANMGWTYKVSTAGKINGVAVEVGDMIICNTDSTAAATSSNYSTIAASWDVIQTNVDGALFKSSNNFTDGHVLVADSTAGKVKDSGFTIGKSVPSNAVFTDTNTKVTSVSNHYSPTANSNSELTASLSGTAGTFKTNTEYTVLTGVKAQRDAKGHVTGLTYTAQKVKDTTIANTDRYVNSAAFADDTTGTPASPVKMTLTRAGSDTATVIGNIPKVSSSSAGVAPKGAAVSTQSQSTKFLREDGTWAAPSYTTNTNTTYKLKIGSTTNGDTTNGVSLGVLESKAAAANGTDLSLVTTGEKNTWNNKSNFSGSYNDLTNKPTIPAAQIQSDWNQTNSSSKDFIKNKPTIPTVPTNVSAFTNDAGYYVKSVSGIPKSDLASSVQTSLGKADTALQSFTETDPTVPAWAKASSKPSYTASEVGAVPTTRTVNGKALSSDVTLDASDVGALPDDTPLFSGDYNDLSNKPTIPAEQVQSDWNQTNNSSKDFIKNKPTIPTVPTNVSAFTNDAGYLTQHQSLSNYVQKSQTAGLIKNDGTIDTNTYLTQHQDISGKANKSEMSVVNGTGTNADKTTITLKSGTSATVLKSHQDISGKQDTLVSGTNIKTINNESILGSGNISISASAELPSNLAYTSDDNGEGIVPSDGIRAESVAAGATMSINADVVTVVTGTVGTATITLQVPQDNLAHVWDILMTTNSTVAITFAMSNSATILYPDGFSVSASKAVEISVIGVGTRYYLRYGEFA